MVHRSHAPSRRTRGTQPGAAAWPRGQFGGVLALQRLAGNRATRALVARDVVKINGETVNISSDADRKEATRILDEMKAKFGLTFDSLAVQHTTRKHYDDMKAATDEQLKAAEARPWTIEELKAFERAAKHFRAVLGDARKKSKLKGTPQELVTVGKLKTSPDDDPKDTKSKSRGEHFPEAQTVAIYEPGSDDDTSAEALERNATHEIAHAVFGPHLKAFMKATGYWSQKLVKSKKARRRGAAGQLRRQERVRGPRAVGRLLLHRSQAPEGGPARPEDRRRRQCVSQARPVHRGHRQRLDLSVTRAAGSSRRAPPAARRRALRSPPARAPRRCAGRAWPRGTRARAAR